LTYLSGKLDINTDTEVWEKFGPYSCLLNIDEVDNIDKTWERVSKEIGVEVEKLKKAITPVKEMYIILDHTRSVLMTIVDGSLPSNVGGGGNVRNILRRVFSLLKKNNWWECLQMEGFLEIFENHKKDLQGIYGEFSDYKSFEDIIRVEYDKWRFTGDQQKIDLEKLLKKNKGVLSINDWIMCMKSWGIPADTIAQVSKLDVPGNLYYEIAERKEKVAKAPELMLYSTVHLPETVNLYYNDHHQY
jgi:alanyl-tRNA synthetase